MRGWDPQVGHGLRWPGCFRAQWQGSCNDYHPLSCPSDFQQLHSLQLE